MSDFDDILKKAKDKVIENDSKKNPKSKYTRWKETLSTIVRLLDDLGKMYDDPKKSSVQVDNIQCVKCNIKSCTITAYDLNSTRGIRFKMPGWHNKKVSGKDRFVCEKCKQ